MAEDSFLNLTEVGAIMAGVLVLAVVCSLLFDMGTLGRGLTAGVMFWISLLAIALGAFYVAARLRQGGGWGTDAKRAKAGRTSENSLLGTWVNKAIFWRVGGSPRCLLLPNGNPPPPHPRITGELGKSPLSREVIGVNGTELVLVLALGVLVALVVASQIQPALGDGAEQVPAASSFLPAQTSENSPSRHLGEQERAKPTRAPHTAQSYYQPYISADTAKYNTSAHEPISATPATHTTPSTNATGISKKRSKAVAIPTDKGAEEVLGCTGDVASISIGAVASVTFLAAAGLLVLTLIKA